MVNCGKTKKETPEKTVELPPNNMLSSITKMNFGGFKWFNEPKSYITGNDAIIVVAEKGTDFFNNPIDKSITATAPFLYKEESGDFVAKALVKPNFYSHWSAISLMMYIDTNNWIKFAFENSDATGKGIVSVVTKEVSDDANGVILNDQSEIWLKLIKKDSIYSMHWSLDNIDYKMARLAAMPNAETVKIGVEFQSPVGGEATHELKYFNIEKKTVLDLRKGE